MLTQSKADDQCVKKRRCFGQKRKFKFLSKMIRTETASPYQRMDDDVKEVKKIKKKVKKSKTADDSKGKENSDAKEKKSKKKTWKLIRQATLSTCRYFGMGVAHMSPVAAYGSPDYYMDPKLWNESYNRHAKNKPPPTQNTLHWTTTMMFSAW